MLLWDKLVKSKFLYLTELNGLSELLKLLMEEFMKLFINLIVLISLLFLVACGGNKVVRQPVEIVKTPMQLAIESALSAESSFEEDDFQMAIEKFNQAVEYYNQALPTSTPEDSIQSKIFNLKKNIANIHIIYAMELTSQSSFDEALSSYETSIDIFTKLAPEATPADSIATLLNSLYKNSAITSRQAGEYSKAIEYFDKYLEGNPDDDDILMQKYAIYRDDLRNEEQALQVLEEYADSKNDFNAYHRLGDLYRDRNDIPKAISFYEKANAIKRDRNVLQKLASMYRHTTVQKWQDSNRMLEQFITMNPSQDELKTAYKLIGDNYKNLKDRKKAVEFFEKNIEMEYSEDIALYINLYYFDMKDNNKTLSWANMILQNNPNNTNALLFRAISKYNLKDNRGAKADFERLKDDPRHGKTAQQYLQIIK
jgi:tetratricopeptide (TPR) repeat protein